MFRIFKFSIIFFVLAFSFSAFSFVSAIRSPFEISGTNEQMAYFLNSKKLVPAKLAQINTKKQVKSFRDLHILEPINAEKQKNVDQTPNKSNEKNKNIQQDPEDIFPTSTLAASYEVKSKDKDELKKNKEVKFLPLNLDAILEAQKEMEAQFDQLEKERNKKPLSKNIDLYEALPDFCIEIEEEPFQKIPEETLEKQQKERVARAELAKKAKEAKEAKKFEEVNKQPHYSVIDLTTE